MTSATYYSSLSRALSTTSNTSSTRESYTTAIQTNFNEAYIVDIPSSNDWSLQFNNNTSPLFLPSPPTSISSFPISSRPITIPPSTNTTIDKTSSETKEIDILSNNGSLSPVPTDFESHTPKLYDSIIVISTPSPLPSKDHNQHIPTPPSGKKRQLNRTRIIEGQQQSRSYKKRKKENVGQQHRRSSRFQQTTEDVVREEEKVMRLKSGDWTEKEVCRLEELKKSSRYYTWREIGVEMNRDWRDARKIWRERHPRTTTVTTVPSWDENKVSFL